MANFFASGLANLREKLGPILWQLPPTMKYDEALLDQFLAGLPHDTDEATTLACNHDAKVEGRSQLDFGEKRRVRHALEVRNDSFVDRSLVALLKKHNVAMVIADTAGKFPQYEDITADFVYVRLHGDEKLYVSNYADQTIAHWSKRIKAWSEGGEPQDARKIVLRRGTHAGCPRCVLLLRQHGQGTRPAQRAGDDEDVRRRRHINRQISWPRTRRSCAERARRIRLSTTV